MHISGRKAILSSLAALLLWGASAGAQSSKFDARLRSRRGASGFAPMGVGAGGPRRTVLIRVAPGTPLAALRAAFPQAEFGTLTGGVATARADDAALDALAADARVASIEHAVPTRPTMDAVRSSGTAPTSGYNVGTIYGSALNDLTNATGQGVVVGVVDTGIDWKHNDFINNPANTSRILWIWDQTISSHSGGPFPTGFTYGAEYSNANLTTKIQGGSNVVNTKDVDGHGTHVASIAAGDGLDTAASTPTFQGMAPRADIIAVRTTFATADVVDGVNYVIAKAAAAGKRAVVNLSLGTMFGPHDGTSSFESALGTIAASTPIVVAMGNDGSSNAHYAGTIAGSAGIQVNKNQATTSADVECWFPGGDAYSMTVTLTGQSGSVTQATPGSNSGTIAGHTVEAYNNVNSGHPLGHKQLYVYVNRPAGITVSSILISLTRTASSGTGRMDCYVDPGSEGVSFASPDQTMTAGEPASANNVFAVASYMSKAVWRANDNNLYTFGDITNLGERSSFSSRGPTRDGRQIPELAAPGDAIGGAYSSDTTPVPSFTLILPDNKHRILRGTSMATPVVTGVLAARMQWGPGRTVSELRQILRAQARADAAVLSDGAAPTDTWGYGKLASSPQPVSAPVGPTAATLGPSSVTWSWSAVTGADSYSLYYATNPSVRFATTANTSYTHTGLAANTTTGALIKGSGAGVDGPGAFISTSTLAAPPAALPAVAPHVTSATVSWTPCPAAPATASCWGYTVLASTRSDMSGTTFSATTLNRGDSFLQVAGLSPLTTYWFRQATLNFTGAQTATGPVSAATLTDLVAPINPLWTVVSTGSIQFEWNPGGNAAGISYAASASTSAAFAGTVFSSTTKNFFAVFSGLAPNTSYYFRVQAVGGPFLAPASPRPTAASPPGVATTTFVGVAQTSFTVAWSSAGNVAGTLWQADVSASPTFSPLVASSATRNTYATFGGLSANTLYYARAQAVGHDGTATSFTTLGSTPTFVLDPAPLAQPFSGQGPGGFTFSFGTGGNPAGTSFNVRVSTGAAFSTLTASAVTTSTSAAFSGLDSNRAYFVGVAALNLSGSPTAFTAAASTATTVVSPASPGGVTARSTGTLSTQWGRSTLAPGTQFQVQASSFASFSLIAGSSTTLNVSATVSGLPPNTSHYLRVRALSQNPPTPDGPWLALGGGSTLANAPSAAATPFPLVGVASVTVSWTPLPLAPQPAACAGYRAEASLNAGFTAVVRALDVSASASSANLSGLAYGTPYWFRVAALDPEGNANYLVIGATRTTTPAVSSGTFTGGDLVLVLPQTFAAVPAVSVDVQPGTFPNGTVVTMLAGLTQDATTARTMSTRLTAVGASIGIDISAGGLQPLKPVKLYMSYDPNQLPPGTDPRRLLVARYDDVSGFWVPVPSAVDVSGRQIVASLDHFSQYAPFVGTPGASVSDGVIYPQPWEIGDPNGAYGGAALTFANFPDGTRIRLMSLTGEQVWEGSATSSGVLTWDGRNAHGRPVGSGTYYAIVEGAGGRKVRRVAVIR